MADRPIIFSAPMVRALLDGRKTMTRRVLTPANAKFGSAPREFWAHADFAKARTDGVLSSGMYLHVPCHSDEDKNQNIVGVDCFRCDEMGWSTTVHRLWPKVKAGDRFWVRESCRAEELSSDNSDGVRYLADDAWRQIEDRQEAADQWIDLFHYRGNSGGNVGKIAPPIHMPRWASRLTLTVTGVKVERLAEISEEDAMAEGMTGATPTSQFADLWRALHGPDAWAANPWVCVVSFTVEKRNIDAA
jgi:hypothetical protein